jgi:hypothetical protein
MFSYQHTRLRSSSRMSRSNFEQKIFSFQFRAPRRRSLNKNIQPFRNLIRRRASVFTRMYETQNLFDLFIFFTDHQFMR